MLIAAVATETFKVGAADVMRDLSWFVAVIAYKEASAAFFAFSAALKLSADISALVQELSAAQIIRPALTTPTILTFDATNRSAAAADAAFCAVEAKTTACWAASVNAV